MAESDIWVSNVLNNSSLIVRTDIDREEVAWESVFKNECPGEENLPVRLYSPYRDDAFDRILPELFTGGGGTKISGKLADVFQRFSLGAGSICPAKLYLHDRKTPTHHDVYLLILGETRQFLVPEQSVGIRGNEPTRHQPNPPPTERWGMPWEPKDGDIAIAPHDLDGLDFWYDTTLFGALFFSDALRQALQDAGYARLFKFLKCNVLAEASD